MIITIDGTAGTGKSTIAKELSSVLGLNYFDTGALYRLAALQIKLSQVDPENHQQVEQALHNLSLSIKEEEKGRQYFLQEKEVTEAIRTEEIAMIASRISQFSFVRKKLMQILKTYGERERGVFEGRDMGTVVFPKACYKFFLQASADVRARRRAEQLKALGKKASVEHVLQEMQKRDQADKEREISPLKPAQDAVVIDTSFLSKEQVLAQILRCIYRKQKKPQTRWSYKICFYLVRLFTKLFYHHQVYGQEFFLAGPCILAANHVSFLDPPLVAVSSLEEIHFLAKEELFKVPYFGSFISFLNAHPLSGSAKDAKVFQKVDKLLAQGKKVLLFPEGMRSKDGELHSLKKGLGLLAYRNQVPIIPIYIQGAEQIWPSQRKYPRFRGRTSCTFGRPIFAPKHWDKKKSIDYMVEKTSQALQNLAKQKKS